MTRRLLALLAIVVLAAACGSSPDGRGEVRIELRRRFRDGAESGRPVDLDLLVPGDWDRMVVVCPSTPEDQAEEALGFTWDGFPGTVEDEGEALLVFPDDDEVVTWSRVRRADGDPCGLPTTAYDRDDTVFTVEDDGGYLVLAPAA